MKKSKFEKKEQHQHRFFYGKFLTLVLACILLAGGVVSGTVAWLTAKTSEVTNVFTNSDISITLQEHKYDAVKDELTTEMTTTGVENYKMIPGWTIPKDPWLTVKANSEDCYLFIKVEEKGGNVTIDSKNYTFDDFISYDIDANMWEQLKNGNDVVENVYIYKGFYKSSTTDTNIKILGYNDDDNFVQDKVLVKDTVTKEMMNALQSSDNLPTLTFTAYASQYWKNNKTCFDAIEAWNNVQPATTP